MEKKNHWGPVEPTKRSEEWSISVAVWESPGINDGVGGDMPKKQLYSAVMPVVGKWVFNSALELFSRLVTFWKNLTYCFYPY